MKFNLMTLNRLILGFMMLIAGLIKIFIFGPSGVETMLSGMVLFSWAPAFWAWILILSEVIFGIAIMANWKLEYTVIPPMIILTVAGLTVFWGNWEILLLHLVAVSNLSIIAGWKFKKRR